MFAMADAFTASIMLVLTKESLVYIGDENLYVSEDGEVSRHDIRQVRGDGKTGNGRATQ